MAERAVSSPAFNRTTLELKQANRIASYVSACLLIELLWN